MIAAGVIMIAAAALIFALHPTFVFVIFAEVLHGVTAGVMTPAIAAIDTKPGNRAAPDSPLKLNRRSFILLLQVGCPTGSK